MSPPQYVFGVNNDLSYNIKYVKQDNIVFAMNSEEQEEMNNDMIQTNEQFISIDINSSIKQDHNLWH